jgi:TolB-like protein/DNA-binding winged helix-turn-helix (wHTH) protein/tetratricopeptide (TPR) repeat protein
MEQQSSTSKSVHFATFDLDLQSGELWKSGRKIRLPHQSFQILARLLERPGELVSREELRQILWPGGTFVDFEVGLSSAVKKLRDALGDSAENPRFVETVPRFGYRFIAPLNGSGASANLSTSVPPLPANTAVASGSVTIPTHADPRRRLRVVAALTLLALTGGVALWSSDARNRLRGFTRPSPIQSIAVLPLENLTGDPAQEYFADGLTDALITDLAENTDLRVISRTSTASYKATKKPLPPLPTIGRELNVDGVIEGAFVRSAGRVRVTAQLIDARTDRHLWAQSFDRTVDDLVALQNDLAHAIAQAIMGNLTARPHVHFTTARKVSAEAEELLFRAFVSAGRGTYQGFTEAISYAQAALDKQPDFARAWASEAVWYIQFSFVGRLAPLEFMPKAEAAARKALELDESLPEAHAALGLVLYRFHWNWPAAERELRRSLQLNPSFADGHRVLAVFLSAKGSPEDVVAEARRARELDPLSAQALMNLGTVHREAGQNEQAIAELLEVLRGHSEMSRAHFQLGVSYFVKGDVHAALEELQTAVRLGRNSRSLSYLGYVDAAIGQKTEALDILNELDALSHRQFVSPFDIAGVQIGLGLKDAALTSLEKACEVRDPEVTRLIVDDRMDALRSDSRFQNVLRRVGLAR